MPSVRLAIYDMDKTITRRATFGPFLTYALPRHRPWRALLAPVAGLATLAYGARLIGRDRLKSANLALMMGRRIDPAQLERLSSGFAGRTLARNMLGKALAQIEADRASGYQIILASASYAFYVQQVGALIGADAVIATAVTPRDSRVSPRIAGENCYGPAKLRMVQDWLAQQGIQREDAHIRFYSDHVSDAPCLDWADEAFATNPHAPLRKLAAQKGWTVLEWRR